MASVSIIAEIGQAHIVEAESSSKKPFRVNFSHEDNTRFDYWKRMTFSPFSDVKGILGKSLAVDKNLPKGRVLGLEIWDQKNFLIRGYQRLILGPIPVRVGAKDIPQKNRQGTEA